MHTKRRKLILRSLVHPYDGSAQADGQGQQKVVQGGGGYLEEAFHSVNIFPLEQLDCRLEFLRRQLVIGQRVP